MSFPEKNKMTLNIKLSGSGTVTPAKDPISETPKATVTDPPETLARVDLGPPPKTEDE